ncbi:mannosyltransferase family protein [Arthrobacter sp. ATA002]|uniref:mannosyltransferase family protein n=1 Tax=Arthrobacter sp. ATA002 TaxID=2991715 RepID=UPI0022A7B0E8|nr:mannosyltransferase family protein [Arthrobacter sp. ATA002]WAP52752.1 mannosyltransferase family protein [Arthrobacter sp. ATA002]
MQQSSAGYGVAGKLSGRQRDLAAIGLWVLGAAAVALLAVHNSYRLSSPAMPTLSSVVAQFARFDYVHFDDIARLGYLPAPGTASTAAPLYAFFPAFPMLLRLGMALGLSSIVTGLAVSAVSGALASVWMRRIADEYVPGLGLKATAVFVTAPPAIFLYAPYSESLFLALGLGAWYFGMRDKWFAAGALCALACMVRISGAFLLAALLVLWLTRNRRGSVPAQPRAKRRSWLFLAIPAAVLAAWMAYLAFITGDLLAYTSAQKYWGRHFEWPWTALSVTVTTYPPTGGPSMIGYAEAIAVAAGAVVTGVLIYRRLYGESVFVGLNVLLLATSSYFYSVPRSALLWWPLWIGIAYLLRRSRTALALYLAFSLYLMLRWANLFLNGQWAG